MSAFFKFFTYSALSASALVSVNATQAQQQPTEAAPPAQAAAPAEAGQSQTLAAVQAAATQTTADGQQAAAQRPGGKPQGKGGKQGTGAANPAASAVVPFEVADMIVCEPINLNGEEAIGPIILRGMDIPQVLELLQQYSGRIVIAGDDLPKNRVNFNSEGTLPRKQAIYALENLLAMNGVMLMRGEGKFVHAAPTRDPSRRATPLLSELPESGQSGQVFTKVFQLQHVTPAEIFNLARNFTSGNNTARIQRLDANNAIMVVDTLNNLRAIERLVQQLDQPAGLTSQIYTFSIRHGDATRIRDTLRQIQRSPAFSSSLGDATLWVDNRTNKLIVVTRPENHGVLTQVIEDLDEEVSPFTTSKVIRITQGNYWSIWGIVQGVVRNQRRQFDRQGFRSTEQTVTRSDRSAEEEGAAAQGASGAAGAATGSTEAAAAQQAQAASQTTVTTETTMMDAGMPEMQFSPYIAIFPDYSNNAFVVYGTQNDIVRMERLIDQLDIKAAPYVASEIVPIQHAHTRDLAQMLTHLINTQRNTFSRRGLQSGASTQQAEDSGIEGAGFQFSDFATIVADWRRNAILIYGTRQDIAQLQGLITQIDQPAAPVTRNEVLYLQHARADTLARMITGVINYQRGAFSRSRNLSQARTGQDAAATAAPSGINEMGFEFSDYAVVYADRRSNALFVYGTQNDITRVRQMVTDSDIAVEPITQTKIFALTHTDANQSASIIQRIVNAQRQALRQVRSESREVTNPAARAAGQDEPGGADPSADTISDGEESLQFSPFMTVTPDVRSNSLVVYGTTGDVSQIEELLKQIDIQVAPFTQSQVFFLKSAQSSSLIGILNNVVRGQERALSRVRSRNREIQNTRGVSSMGTGAEDSALQFSPYVTIVENRRNNAIIVYGTPSDISQIGSLIETNDVAIAPYTQTRTFSIRHADAVDTARTITTLINQQQRVREREATLQRVFRRSLNQQGAGDEQLPAGEAGAAEAIAADEAMLNDSLDPNAGADLQFSPYVSLVADDRSNSVIVYGTQFDLQQIEGLIEQIDKVLPQVRIEVVIAEVRLQGNQVTGLSSFGINYRNPFDFQRVSQTTGGVVNEQIMGNTGIQTGMQPLSSGDTQGAFDLGLSLNDFSLTTVFRVAQEDQNVKVLSAPTITTSHNRRAQINVGEARPIITGTTTGSSSDLVTRSTVEYRDIGITLRVRPLVSESGAIQMELEQIVETVIGEQTIDRNVQPIISTRRALSFVSVRDREIIIMGGLQSSETTKREGKVFLLGDIPLLGELFRPERDEEIVRELIIFIRPYLVTSTDPETFYRENELDKKAIGEDVKYFLEEGRFREQDRLRKKEEEKQQDQQPDAQGDASRVHNLPQQTEIGQPPSLQQDDSQSQSRNGNNRPAYRGRR